jgi:hypothetical protein
VGTTDE